jgi:uncharacterized protein (TIGR02679 family)
MTSRAAPQSPDSKLHRRLGGADLGELRQRMRRHFERYGDGPEKDVLHLTRLTPLEYEAVAQLVGLPARATQSVRIEIALLDAALNNAGIARSLRDALEMIDGPLVHRAAVQAEAQARWAAVLSSGPRHPDLGAWLALTGATGVLKRLARRDADLATRLLGRADAVLRELPVNGLTRAQLAAKALGDAHALDGGQPVATLVVAALRHRQMSVVTPEAGVPDEATEDAERGQSPERVRDIWARVGVLVNELARPALYLNLPVHSSSPQPGTGGEPGYLSLRRLLRTRFEWAVEKKRVYVCENPNIVSIAADRLGPNCPPLVCTDGMPAAAQRVLLTQLAGAGAELHYHGDFDWAGIHIANHVMQSFSSRPWRFGSCDYVEALALLPQKDRDLVGDGVPTPWDPALLDHMRRHRLAVDEEAVAALLLGDLEHQGAATGAQAMRR